MEEVGVDKGRICGRDNRQQSAPSGGLVGVVTHIVYDTKLGSWKKLVFDKILITRSPTDMTIHMPENLQCPFLGLCFESAGDTLIVKTVGGKKRAATAVRVALVNV